MINDKYCDRYHIIHSINNRKNMIIRTMKKIYLLNNTSFLLNNIKTYTIPKKKNN
jgi:hypothetical protein